MLFVLVPFELGLVVVATNEVMCKNTLRNGNSSSVSQVKWATCYFRWREEADNRYIGTTLFSQSGCQRVPTPLLYSNNIGILPILSTFLSHQLWILRRSFCWNLWGWSCPISRSALTTILLIPSTTETCLTTFNSGRPWMETRECLELSQWKLMAQHWRRFHILQGQWVFFLVWVPSVWLEVS